MVVMFNQKQKFKGGEIINQYFSHVFGKVGKGGRPVYVVLLIDFLT